MSKSSVGKIVLATLSVAAAVASVVLVIIYASLAVDVIGYITAAEKESTEGLGAAVGLIIMVIVGAGIAVLAITGTILFAISRRMRGGVRTIASVTFVYHIFAAVLAIITLLIIKFLS